ncbi:MAG: hypothetical protein SGARI_000375 [Bacillariaceae sp.]
MASSPAGSEAHVSVDSAPLDFSADSGAEEEEQGGGAPAGINLAATGFRGTAAEFGTVPVAPAHVHQPLRARLVGMSRQANQAITQARRLTSQCNALRHSLGDDVEDADASFFDQVLVNVGPTVTATGKPVAHPETYFDRAGQVTAADISTARGFATVDPAGMDAAVGNVETVIQQEVGVHRNHELDSLAQDLRDLTHGRAEIPTYTGDLGDTEADYRESLAHVANGLKRRRLTVRQVVRHAMGDTRDIAYNRAEYADAEDASDEGGSDSDNE